MWMMMSADRVVVSRPSSLLLSLCVVIATVAGQSHDNQTILTLFTDDDCNVSFQHLVVDLRTDRLYVSATNRLYQLDGRLRLEAAVTTGPQADNPFCPPPPTADCHDARRVPTDAVSKALALDRHDQRLIACTNLFQGHCERRRLSNITLVDKQIWSMVVPNDAVSPTVVFVAPGPPNPATTDVVYVAATRSTVGLPAYRDIVPAICARNRHDLALVSDDILTPSRVDVEVQHRDTFRVDYVAGFSSGGFSYFVAVQRSSATSEPNSPPRSYLARVCHADRSFASYVEVPLQCRWTAGADTGRVTAVHLTRPGSTLARALGLHPSSASSTNLDEILVAVFTSSSMTHEGLRTSTIYQHATSTSSALCVYTMRDVRQTFTAAIQKCFRGVGNTGPDHLVQPKPCFLTPLEISDNYCGEHGINHPIRGTDPVSSPAQVTWSHDDVTSVAVASTGSHTVAFIGTSNGHVKKFRVYDKKTGNAKAVNGGAKMQD